MSDIIKKLEENTTKIAGCWLFEGPLDGQGYGAIRYDGKQVGVHRLSAHLFLGFNLDSDMWILHKRECPNKNCWNPEHLYIGTPKENTRDFDIDGRPKRGRYKTHCPQGHEYTPENTRIDKKGAQTCRECNRLRYYNAR